MSERRTEAEIIRDAYSPGHMLLRAPVQHYEPGIPWPMHLEAYAVYCKRYSPQPAMIDLKGRGCRGGFSDGELDVFIPGWRERVSPITELQQRIVAVRAICEDHEKRHPDPSGQPCDYHCPRQIIDEIRKAIGAE